MIRTRLALALAAAALLSCQGSMLGGRASGPVSGVWLVVPSASSLWFVGIKNNAVAVPGYFSGMEGGFDVAKGEGWFEVRVATLATGDPGRDANLRVHFFDSLQFPVARFSLTGIPSPAELPAVGATVSTTLAGTFQIHGGEFPLSVPVNIARDTSGRIRVSNAKPVILSAKDLGMEQPLAVLKAVCGHESVSGAVPIEFDILFTPI